MVTARQRNFYILKPRKRKNKRVNPSLVPARKRRNEENKLVSKLTKTMYDRILKMMREKFSSRLLGYDKAERPLFIVELSELKIDLLVTYRVKGYMSPIAIIRILQIIQKTML